MGNHSARAGGARTRPPAWATQQYGPIPVAIEKTGRIKPTPLQNGLSVFHLGRPMALYQCVELPENILILLLTIRCQVVGPRRIRGDKFRTGPVQMPPMRRGSVRCELGPA